MSEKDKKQAIILGVLFLGLGIVLYITVLKPDPGQAAIEENMAKSRAAMAANAGGDGLGTGTSVFEEVDIDISSLVQNIKEVGFNYREEHDARNPTNPLVGGGAFFNVAENAVDGSPLDTENLLYEANRKDLTGIIWDKANPLAIIDNEVVFVGYEFPEPIFVKSIGPDHVVLTLANEEAEIVKELKEQ